MKAGKIVLLGASLLTLGLIGAQASTSAKKAQQPMVRIAEIEIFHAHLERYKALLREEIEASIRLEPGVLTLYAVSLKDQPTHIRIFETYADVKAYHAHLQT